MAGTKSTVEVGLEGGPFTDVPTRSIRGRAEKMLAHLGLERASVSIMLIDDRAMKALHARWMNDPTTTDVLSFPLHDKPRKEVARGGPIALGDIAICVPQARRQARARKATPVDEATALLAHGVLHLLGFDHRNADEEREMFALGRVLEVAAINKKPLAGRITLAG
jgi:probable rRNA maturation factor